MDFLFHSVYHDGRHSRYYNVYKISADRYLAQCHHFNRDRDCTADFELIKAESGWELTTEEFKDEGAYIAEEIDRSNGVAVDSSSDT